MKVAISYPPIVNEIGQKAMVSQNRNVQFFSVPTYLLPVIHAQAASTIKNKVEVISPKEYKIPYHHGIKNIDDTNRVDKLTILSLLLPAFCRYKEKINKKTIKKIKFEVLDRKRFLVISHDMKKPTPDNGPDVSSTLYGPPRKPASSFNVLK